MEWLPKEEISAFARPRTESSIGPFRVMRSNARQGPHLYQRRQYKNSPCNMVLLDSADPIIETTYMRENLSPRGGKRPRTTPFMIGAVSSRTGMDLPDVQNGNVQKQPSLFRPSSHAGQGNALFFSAIPAKKRNAGGAITAAVPRQTANSVVTCEDTLGEAEAMAADEARSSPPGAQKQFFDNQLRDAPVPSRTLTNEGNKCMVKRTRVRSQYSSIGHEHTELSASSIGFTPFCNVVAGDEIPSPAPAYELSESGGESWLSPFRNKEAYDRNLGGKRQGEITEDGKVDGTNASMPGSSHGNSSKKTSTIFRAEGETHIITAEDMCQQNISGDIFLKEGDLIPPPVVTRDSFLSKMTRSSEAYEGAREDLLRYMESVRGKTSKDGTPSVAFPKNFDRVVGLMVRSDLNEGLLTQKVSKKRMASRRKGGKASDDGFKGGTAPPPWTAYLLEEGLDRTKAFSKYRGMFAEEQTGETRLMRGLAKMKELDIRLEKATERARELRKMARDAMEEAERAAGGGDAGTEQNPPYRHSRGRGPVAIDDISSAPPPVPSAAAPSESSLPVVPAPRLNGCDPQGQRGSWQPEGDSTPPTTERLEKSTASGSRSNEGRDARARGRAFVTQKGSRALSGLVPSTANSATGDSAGSSSRSGRKKGIRHGKAGSSKTGGEECANSGGGGSGVSFVLRNKQHAARPRRRLTEEQENLVSRFLEDADGFDEEGQPMGEPSGVWAEIAPYGGVGGEENTARLAEINAEITALRGRPLSDNGDGNDDAAPHEEENESRSSSGRTTTSTKSCSQRGFRVSTKKGCQSAGWNASSSNGRKVSIPRVDKGDAPGEETLREQRARREARYRERAIDTALEQLRESLFDGYSADQACREKAVDVALQQARSANLNVQAGVRRGAGRVDSLIDGDGIQPVGEWEVIHALRQSEEELRGKDLASREKIEELLANVRRESASFQRTNGGGFCRTHSGRQDENTVGDLLPGTSLGMFLPTRVVEPREGNTDKSSADAYDDTSSVLAAARALREQLMTATPRNPLESKVGAIESGDVICRTVDVVWRADQDYVGSPRLAERMEETRPPRLKGEHDTVGTARGSSRTSEAEGESQERLQTKSPDLPYSALPRRKARNNNPSATTTINNNSSSTLAIAPELAALFRAPLLAPRIDPPLAGAAAAAVASGGTRRLKPKVGPVTTRVIAGGQHGAWAG